MKIKVIYKKKTLGESTFIAIKIKKNSLNIRSYYKNIRSKHPNEQIIWLGNSQRNSKRQIKIEKHVVQSFLS